MALLLPSWAAAAGYENFRSEVRSLTPTVEGLELEVVRGDEGLRLRNETGETVVVEGYDGEPYLRFKPDGIVEANQRSAATYINVDRFGLQEVPEDALPGAKPRWKPVADGGTYTWFDHRIHLTAKEPPARFTRRKELTKVLDWQVPMAVDGSNVRASGALFWDPEASSDESDGFPFVAVGAIALALIAAGTALVLWRRRRPPRPATEGAPEKEAW